MSNRTSVTIKSESVLDDNPAICSDDNDILELQKKTLKLIGAKFAIKDNENVEPVSSPIQFSVEVKVDRYDSDNTIQNCNLTPSSNSSEQKELCTYFSKITDELQSNKQEHVFYVRIACPNETKKLKNYTTVNQYSITNENIIKATEKQSKESTEESDKYLDIYCRNLHGQFKIIRPSFIDEELTRVLKIWSMWFKMYPMSRDTPLMYKCYICCKGWWRLHPFREHLKGHNEHDLKLRSEPVYHNFNIIASTKHAKMIKNVKMDSDCWKCGKDSTYHNVYNYESVKYHCLGCNKSMVTCTRLKEHESICKRHKELTFKKYNINAYEALTCSICNTFYVNAIMLDNHMVECHLVRSDEPAVLESKLCRVCNCRYFIFKFHDCPAKTKPYNCDICCRTFSSLELCQIHIKFSKNRYVKCTLCKKLIPQCMVPKHFLKHSKNYCLMDTCNNCNTGLLFTNETICENHMNAHGRKCSSSQILLPTKCLNGEFVNSKTTFRIPDENLDNFLAGFDDIKGIPIDTEMNLQEDEEDSSHAPSIPDTASDDADSDVIIVDDDDVKPPMELAFNSQNLETKEFDLKAMQAQLDMEIMRDVEAEATISELFKASKSYHLLMQKESLERQSEENRLKYEEIEMKEKIKRESIKDELIETKSIKRELKPKLMNLEDNMDLNEDVIILDNGVEDVAGLDYPESEVTPKHTDVTCDSAEYEEETDSEAGNLVIDCDSSDSNDNSDRDTCERRDEETYNNNFSIKVDPEVFIQENVKVELSENHLQDINDDTLQMVDGQNCTETIKSEFQFYKCKGCDYRGLWNKFVVHVSTECPGTEFRCVSCSQLVRFFNLNQYLQHLIVHDSALVCPQCRLQLKSLDELYPHVNSHIQTLFSVANTVKPQESYHCKICQDSVQLEHFFKHWQMHLNRAYPDTGGDTSSEDSSDSGQYRGLEKPMSEELIEEVMNILQNKATDRQVTNCVVCKRKSSRWQECKRHLIQHLLFQAVHIRNKMKRGILKCFFCDKGYKMDYHWKFHMREHCDLRVYKCELCSKCFSDSSNLSKHRKMHNLFAYVCDLCGGKFQIKRSLISHLKLHENAFQCAVCHTKFLSVSKMRKHVFATHRCGRRRQFKCSVCPRKFPTCKEKQQHVWQKHEQRGLVAECPLCDSRFGKLPDLKRHIKLKHKISYEELKAKAVIVN